MRKKLLFTLPVLMLCGLIVVLCKALSVGASDWVQICLLFLPIFFCSTIVAVSGIVLTRIYHHEVKQLPISFREIINESKELMVHVAYFCIPIVLAYILLWTILGIFYLLKEIPVIGDGLGEVLSFGPFLILLGSFALSVISVTMLFYLIPAVALKSSAHISILEDALKRFKTSPFSNIALFVLGLIPILFVVLFMVISALMTWSSFIILPFCALLSPALIFFFNFAAESYAWFERRCE